MAPPPASSAPHVVILPFQDQGHVAPALYMAMELASRQIPVTFVNTQHNHDSLVHNKIAPTPDIRFLTIPDAPPRHHHRPPPPHLRPRLGPPPSHNLPPPPPPDDDPLGTQRPALESLIEDLEKAGSPVSCLISDAFLGWAGEVAQKQKIPWVVFWTSSVAWLCVSCFDEQEVPNTGLPWTSAHMAPPPPGPEHMMHHARERKAVENANCILVNSIDEIEREALSAVPSKIPIWSIGPLIQGAGSGFHGFRGNLFEPDESCLAWLDTQQAGSVLYISFGSRASMSAEQLAELARGIEASEKPFLWVDRGLEQLPEGFRERTKTLGRVVKWAPQLEVLGHRSVGAFLTHCGWNSVLEAIARGVAMVCWPLMSDQFAIRVLVEEQWKVGKGVRARRIDGEEEGMELVEASEVSRVVREVMEDEDLKQRANVLRHYSEVARLPGGSSYLNLEAFLQHIHSSRP